MAINSLSSRNWTDDQWYNFICGLIKEPSIAAQPPAPYIDLGLGYAYIIPPDMVLESVRVTQPNEVYIEVHLYDENVQAASFQVKSYVLRLDTKELIECQQIDSDYLWISAYKVFVGARYYKGAFARLAKQSLDKNLVRLDITSQTQQIVTYNTYVKQKSVSDLSVSNAFMVSTPGYHVDGMFGTGRVLFFHPGSQTTRVYELKDNGTMTWGLYAYGTNDNSSEIYLIQKAIVNGSPTYINLLSLGLASNGKFVAWVHDLDNVRSYGYVFSNVRLRFSMTVAGYLYLSGTFTNKVFIINNCAISVDSDDSVFFLDNPAAGDDVVISSCLTSVLVSSSEGQIVMSRYGAHFEEDTADTIELLGINENYDVGEINQFNIVYVALPNTSSLTDSDHVMFITYELDGLNTFMFSISTGEISQYGTNPNVPTALPYRWSCLDTTASSRMNEYPTRMGFVGYTTANPGSSIGNTVNLAYTRIGQSGVEIVNTVSLASSHKYLRGLVAIDLVTWIPIFIFTGYTSNRTYVAYQAYRSGSGYSLRTLTSTRLPNINNVSESTSVVADYISECGDSMFVFWTGDTGYLFRDVVYTWANLASRNTWTGTFTGWKFVIPETGLGVSSSRTTVCSNGLYACIYKLLDGGGSKIIYATETQEVITIS